MLDLVSVDWLDQARRAIGDTDIVYLDSAQNLSDLVDAATARVNLGVEIGVDVQAYDAGLQSISGLTTAADTMLYATAADTYATAPLTAAGRALLDDTAASDQRTTMGVAIGTDVQAWDADLDTYAANPLTAAELGELQNIDATTISATQWGYVGGADQAVKTTDTPTFVAVNLGDTALSHYKEGTWTPALSFGGGSTGITYGSRTGTYVQTGKWIYFTIQMTLTNKGSSTGTAAITLPTGLAGSLSIVTDNGIAHWAKYSNMSGISSPNGRPVSASSLQLQSKGSAAIGTLSNTNFTNTSSLTLVGHARLA